MATGPSRWLAIRAAEAHRGPTLVFAHNRHLQRHPSTMTMAGLDLSWFSAGAIVGALLGDRYAVIAGSLGASPALNIEAPATSTYEGKLQKQTHLPRYVHPSEVEPAGQRTHDYRYFPLDQATIEHADAVLHIPTGTGAAMHPAEQPTSKADTGNQPSGGTCAVILGPSELA